MDKWQLHFANVELQGLLPSYKLNELDFDDSTKNISADDDDIVTS